MGGDCKVILGAVTLFALLLVSLFVRYINADAAFGYSPSGFVIIVMMVVSGVLLLFIRIIGQDANWALYWAVCSIGVATALIQTAITGSDLSQALHLDALNDTRTSPMVIAADFSAIAIVAIFWTLIGSYVAEWRPYQSTEDLRYGLMASGTENSGVAARGAARGGDAGAADN